MAVTKLTFVNFKILASGIADSIFALSTICNSNCSVDKVIQLT